MLVTNGQRIFRENNFCPTIFVRGDNCLSPHVPCNDATRHGNSWRCGVKNYRR